ncbi:VOC family protein [Cupriavidus basilensis]
MELLINIDVDDLPRGIGFYQEGLGLRLSRKLFDDTVAEMTGGAAAHLPARQAAWHRPTSRADTRRDYPRHWTPVHLDFVVDNLESAIERAPGSRRGDRGLAAGVRLGAARLRCRTRSGMGFVLLSGRVKGTGTPGTNPLAILPSPQRCGSHGNRQSILRTITMQSNDTVPSVQRTDREPRQGWAKDSQAIAAAGEDALVLGDFANDGDEDLHWPRPKTALNANLTSTLEFVSI